MTIQNIFNKLISGVVASGSNKQPLSQCSYNKLRTSSAYDYQVDHGNRGTHIGFSDDIGTIAFEVLANVDLSQPSEDIQMEVVSDNVADTAAGAGVQKVRITYFNEAWEKLIENIELDGITPVDTIATDFYRIEKFEVVRGRPAVGTITLKDTTGTTLYAQMEPLTTFMERAMHYVARGERCVVTDLIIGTQTKEGIIFRLFKSQVYGTDVVTKARYSVALLETNMEIKFNVPIVLENPDGLRLAVGVGVRGLAATQGGSGSFRYYCEDI